MLANERISIRTTAQAKSAIEKASSLTGVSVSHFMVEVAYQKALETIENSQRIVLADSQWVNAVALLDNPPTPNTKMAALFEQGYKVADQ